MKRFTVMALALLLVAALCAGCRRSDKKEEPMATTTAQTTPAATTTAPTTPMMTTPTDPMMPNDSIGDQYGQNTMPGTNDGANNGADDGIGGAGESSRSTNRGRMRRIG